MLTIVEFLLLFVISTFSSFLALYTAYRVIKPRLGRQLQGYSVAMGNRMVKEMGKMAENALEGVDLGNIAGALGGGGGEGNPLGALTSMLGGQGGGLGDILGLLGNLSGKQTTSVKRPDHRPGK